MDFWSSISTGGIDISTYPGLDSIKCEDFDLVDSQMCAYLSDNQKPIVQCPLGTVYSNSDSFFLSDSTSSGTPSTTNSGTMGVSRQSPFQLFNSIMGGSMDGSMSSMGSSEYSSMNSTTLYISPTTPSTSINSPHTTPTFSSGSATTSSTATAAEIIGDGWRKRNRLDHLTVEQKIFRRKAKNRLAAQMTRDRKKAKLSNLELTVTQLISERAQLLAQQATLQRELQAMESEFKSIHSAQSLNTSCAYCDHFHQQQGHNDNSN